MEDIENFKGYLLAAHPKRADSILKKGVVLIIDHDISGAIGLQINKPLENSTSLGTIMSNMGLPLKDDDSVYFGGPENTNRIIVLHSLDWSSSTTTKIGENFGISNDISVLAAISQGKGPDLFRAIAGYVRWPPGHLENEIDMLPPWDDISKSWQIKEAEIDDIFSVDKSDQWHYILDQSAKQQISTWF
jgi:putative transcriptional regulator